MNARIDAGTPYVDGAAAEKIFLVAEQAAGGFDLVINNAGFGAFGAFADTDFSIWEEQLRMMLVNTARLSHVALRGMLARRRGALVNISSLAAEFPLPYQSAYNMVKSGLSALNESLMFETAGTGVIVIDFRPGDYRTDFEGSVRRAVGPMWSRASWTASGQRRSCRPGRGNRFVISCLRWPCQVLALLFPR